MRKFFLVQYRAKIDHLINPNTPTVIHAECHGFISFDKNAVVVIDKLVFQDPLGFANINNSMEVFKEVLSAAMDAYKEMVHFVSLQNQMN